MRKGNPSHTEILEFELPIERRVPCCELFEVFLEGGDE